MEVVEQDHTRIRVLDFLVLNIEAACNIIKNNTVKTLELAQIYGSFLKNHSNAEKILAQSVELIKQLQDFELIFKIYKIYGLSLQLSDKTLKSIVIFEMLRDIAYEIKDTPMIMESYRLLGFAYQQAKNYELAITCYKKILLYAWYFKNG